MAGNSNSGRKAEKPFRDALRMELAEAGDNPKALRNIAKALIAQAEAGDMQAIKEFADRIDGKAVQQLDVDATVRNIEDMIAELGSE
jgi:cytochrome c-type biogenesis protein CcmH/NrfG